MRRVWFISGIVDQLSGFYRMLPSRLRTWLEGLLLGLPLAGLTWLVAMLSDLPAWGMWLGALVAFTCGVVLADYVRRAKRWLVYRQRLPIIVEFKDAAFLKGHPHQGWYFSVTVSILNRGKRPADLEASLLVSPRADGGRSSWVRAMHSEPPVEGVGDPDLAKPLSRPTNVEPEGTAYGSWFFHIDPLVMQQTGITNNAISFRLDADLLSVRDLRSNKTAEWPFASDYPSGERVKTWRMGAAVPIEQMKD